MRSSRMVAMRSLLAIAAVPSVSSVDRTPLGRVAWLFRVAAFVNAERVARKRFAEIEARCRRFSHLAAAEEIRSLYSGSNPRAPGIDGRPQPPTGNERP